MRALRRQSEMTSAATPSPRGLAAARWEGAYGLPRIDRRSVAILLSVYNGESFLTAQLHSFLAQTHHDWTLYWRDDGSNDGSVAQVQDFTEGLDKHRCVAPEGGGTQQITSSFLRLLRAARKGPATYFAFSDQDDVWMPEKMARGVAALAAVPPSQPAVYSAQRILVDSALRWAGEPGPLRRPPGFPQALIQNVMPGCTMMMNRAAADLVLASNPPDAVWHDWWCYIVVAAAGGRIIADPEPAVLYRQHGKNRIGEPRTWWRRGIAALRRGPAPFMRLLRWHVATLQANPDLLPDSARQQLAVIERGLQGSIGARLRALRLPGLVRQTWLETLVFRVWFMIG